MYRLRDLFEWNVQREIVKGVWVAARPVDGPLIGRIKAAWAVLRGRADAFTWPTKDDPTTWCAAGCQQQVTLIDEHGSVSRSALL